MERVEEVGADGAELRIVSRSMGPAVAAPLHPLTLVRWCDEA